MSEKTTETTVPSQLRGIVDIVYLNRDNCEITEKNGFIGIRAILDKGDDDISAEGGTSSREIGDFSPSPEERGVEPSEPGTPDILDSPIGSDRSHGRRQKRDNTPAVTIKELGGGKVEKRADVVFLSRAFPFDMPWEYISVLDRDKKELGFIRSIDDFDEPARSLLKKELESIYYTPKIKRILSVKERYGFSYWKCLVEFGEKSFTLKDTVRSLIKTYTKDGNLRVFIIDVDGNRYEIPNIETLDRQSYKKIELYL